MCHELSGCVSTLIHSIDESDDVTTVEVFFFSFKKVLKPLYQHATKGYFLASDVKYHYTCSRSHCSQWLVDVCFCGLGFYSSICISHQL